tara:strand:+ start:328 stop:642 length:315 start_codon:yes stop_codon:yes gene_type:complete
MAHISYQAPLITTREVADIGLGGSVREILASNYSGSAVITKVYAVPNENESSTITDHLIWIVEVAANSTSKFDLQNAISFGKGKYRLEAEAASNSAITLTVLGH